MSTENQNQTPASGLRRRAAQGALLLFAVLLASLAAEGVAQFYAFRIAKRGKLFQPDATLGWRVLPDLNLKRLNADEQPWSIQTDRHGLRGPSEFAPQASRRLLVLGDSFAFGEGVDLPDRFDSVLAGQLPGYSVVNAGVMGYDTYQAILAGRGWIPQLRPGDGLILLTSNNDFRDVLMRHHSGRSKPWVAILPDGMLVGHPPQIGLKEHLRDKSYLLARIFAAADEQRLQSYDLNAGLALYEKILEEYVAPIARAGVRVILCFHGNRPPGRNTGEEAISAMIARIRGTGIYEVVDLDPVLLAGSAPPFQQDGHWNVAGHRMVAGMLAEAIMRSAPTQPVLPPPQPAPPLPTVPAS